MRILSILLMLFILSCTKDDKGCSVCETTALYNGKAWIANDKNHVQKIIDYKTEKLKFRFTVVDSVFGYIYQWLSFTDIKTEDVGKTFNLLDHKYLVDDSAIVAKYSTMKSDGDVIGSFYDLDTTFNNYFILDEINDDQGYVKARFQFRIFQREEDIIRYPEDDRIITFTDGNITAEILTD